MCPQATSSCSAVELAAKADNSKLDDLEEILALRTRNLEAAILKGLKTVSEKAALALNQKVNSEVRPEAACALPNAGRVCREGDKAQVYLVIPVV